MAREIQACAVCGANFSATEENEFCPVCMLQMALAGGVESGESFSEDGPIRVRRTQRSDLSITSW